MLTTLKLAIKPAALTLLVGTLLHPAAWAEEAQSTGSKPQDAKADVPKVVYQSAFDGYTAWDDAPMKDWRQANQDVMGDEHAGHGNATPPDAGKADPHAGHSMKHGGHP